MASSNRLVVEVVGDTSKLTASLNNATQQINRFAGKSKISSTAADPLAARTKSLREESEALLERSRAVNEQAQIQQARFSALAVKAGVVGLAVNRLGANFQSAGGNIGKFGNALSALSTGNIVGFVKGIQSLNETDPKKLAADLFKFGDAAKATELANKAAAAGFDTLAVAARGAEEQIRETTNAFVDNTKIRDSTSVGAIAAETSSIASAKQRPGVSQSQRNEFFDNDITRALDRAQDGSLKKQVAKLKEVEQTLRDRLKVTKDITRQLRLEDEIAGVQRQQRGIEDTIAQNAKERAEAAARAAAELKREREAREKALEEARRVALQAKQFRALGFAADGSEVVAGTANLRKQFASLTDRLEGSNVNLSSKLESQLDGVRKVLSGKFGQVTRESRERIQDLFETIRGEFDKGSKGPLTKTTQLSTDKILAGLGLSPADSRVLKARLSHFNSAGKALAGTGAGSRAIVVQAPDVILDGRKISNNTSKHQGRKRSVNTSPRNGPNAGAVIN